MKLSEEHREALIRILWYVRHESKEDYLKAIYDEERYGPGSWSHNDLPIEEHPHLQAKKLLSLLEEKKNGRNH